MPSRAVFIAGHVMFSEQVVISVLMRLEPNQKPRNSIISPSSKEFIIFLDVNPNPKLLGAFFKESPNRTSSSSCLLHLRTYSYWPISLNRLTFCHKRWLLFGSLLPLQTRLYIKQKTWTVLQLVKETVKAII